MSRFINPFTDVGFKKIFGQEVNKDLLLSFLNNLLMGERVINDLRFLDKEQMPEMGSSRELVFDVFCETSDGENIIVEMQLKGQDYFQGPCDLLYVSGHHQAGCTREEVELQGTFGVWGVHHELPR